MRFETQLQHIINTTRDPFTQLTCSEMNITSEFTRTSNEVALRLRAGFPCKLLKTTLVPALKDAFSEAFPNDTIHITLESSIMAHQTQMPGKSLRGVKNTIAIASGKGGVGKSTVTVNLASALVQQGSRVGILDADIYGPSIPTMLGKSSPVNIKEDHYLPVIAHGIQTMSIGYLSDNDNALIWRGPMLAKAMIQMLDLTLWDDLDYLFIDLPPGTGDIQLSLVQKIPLTAAIIVTTPQTVATMDAQKALAMFERTHIAVLGIVENMSIHTCSSCGHQDPIFGKNGGQHLGKRHHVPLLGQLPLDHQITVNCDQGVPTHNDLSGLAFLKTALNSVIELSKRALNYSNKFPPIVIE